MLTQQVVWALYMGVCVCVYVHVCVMVCVCVCDGMCMCDGVCMCVGGSGEWGGDSRVPQLLPHCQGHL